MYFVPLYKVKEKGENMGKCKVWKGLEEKGWSMEETEGNINTETHKKYKHVEIWESCGGKV